MTAAKIQNLTLHGSSGVALKWEERIKWFEDRQGMPNLSEENRWGFGQLLYYAWEVDGKILTAPAKKDEYRILLPDRNGFIIFEQRMEPDNCLLLDAYGVQRFRLTVPRELTGSSHRESGLPPTSFINISDPYVNPIDNKEGHFGVTAWVELAGKFYFELDCETGQFLWGKPIMD